MRSFLFVPGDSVRKFESAKKTAADALILDLEDSIAPDQKVAARGITRDMLNARKPDQKIYIRINAFDTDLTLGDLAAVMPGRPDGIVLPKCAGAADVNKLALYLDAFEAASGIGQGATRIVPVATETARAVMKLFDFENISPRLWGMMWGAEDLAASLGASRNRTDGRFHSPFRLARDLCLIAASAAGVVAIDTVATDIDDLDALRRRGDRRTGGRLSSQGRDPPQACRCRQCGIHADRRGNRLVGAGRGSIRGQPLGRREDGRQDGGQAASACGREDFGAEAAIAFLAGGILRAVS